MADISPAAVRLYARSVEIEIEVEEAIADGDHIDHMTTEELLSWSDRLLRDDDFDSEAEERKARAAIVAKHAWPAAWAWPQSARHREALAKRGTRSGSSRFIGKSARWCDCRGDRSSISHQLLARPPARIEETSPSRL